MAVVKGGPFKPTGRIEARYRAEIDRLLDQYFKVPEAAGLGEITARLVEWSQVDRVFRRYAERAASSMVTAVAAQNARSWREAATKSTKGPLIYQLLRREMAGPVGRVIRAQVARSAELITSVPAEVAASSQRFIAAEQMKGRRAGEIARELRVRIPTMSRAKAALLARTGSSTAETTVTRARSETLGMEWYEWQTSEDARVRLSHRKMDKVLVSWNDPPSPEALIGVKSTLGHYHAGQCPNCRCPALPLVSVDEVSWPHKVYNGGKIQWMTRAAFLRLAPRYRIAA